jgi:hypothetical protein
MASAVAAWSLLAYSVRRWRHPDGDEASRAERQLPGN